MEFIKSGLNLGKKIGKAGLGFTEKVGNTALGLAGSVGDQVIGSAFNNSGKFIASVGGIGLAAGALASEDGQTDVRNATIKGGLIGAGLATIPGGMTAGAAIGVGVLGLGATSISAIETLGNSMVKLPTSKIGIETIGEVGLTGIGKGLLTGASVISGIRKGYKAFEKSRMGTNDGQFRKATPSLPVIEAPSIQGPNYNFSYRKDINFAGATGDLVFSLYDNR